MAAASVRPSWLARHLPGAHGELRVEGDADVGLAEVRLPVAQRADEVVPARLHVQHQHPVDPADRLRGTTATMASSWWVRYRPLGVGNGWATVAISSNIGITGWPGRGVGAGHLQQPLGDHVGRAGPEHVQVLHAVEADHPVAGEQLAAAPGQLRRGRGRGGGDHRHGGGGCIGDGGRGRRSVRPVAGVAVEGDAAGGRARGQASPTASPGRRRDLAMASVSAGRRALRVHSWTRFPSSEAVRGPAADPIEEPPTRANSGATTTAAPLPGRPAVWDDARCDPGDQVRPAAARGGLHRRAGAGQPLGEPLGPAAGGRVVAGPRLPGEAGRRHRGPRRLCRRRPQERGPATWRRCSPTPRSTSCSA